MTEMDNVLLAGFVLMMVMMAYFRISEISLRRDLNRLLETLRIMRPGDTLTPVPRLQTNSPVAQVLEQVAVLLHEQGTTHKLTEDGLKQELVTLRQRCDNCPAETRVLSMEADLVRMKREFLATIHHELLTPMNGILGMIDLATEDAASQEQRDYCLLARESALILLNMIRDILLLTRLEAGEIQLVVEKADLATLLRNIVSSNKPAADEKGLLLSYEFIGEVNTWPSLDVRLLERVIDQLLNNAIKFTREGHISITVRTSQATARQMEIAVQDTGIGMAPELVKQLFESIGQGNTSAARSQYGIGLGLYLVRRLLTAMGGTISVESSPDHGSTFRITLPEQAPMTPGPAKLPENPGGLAGA